MSLPFYISYVGLWVVVAFQTVLLVGIMRTVYRKPGEAAVRESEDRLKPGSRLPSFSVEDITGATIDSERLVGRQTALLFVSPNCDSCAVTLEELDALHAKTGGNVVVFCLAERTTCSQLIDDYGLRAPVVVDDEHRIAGLLRVSSAPTAVLVDRFGYVETYGHPRAPVDLERLLTVEASEEEFRLDIHRAREAEVGSGHE